jgi:imidazole glycerol-phosphate synthase subunit HisH
MANIESDTDIIGIIDYGVGNIQSLTNALDYISASYQIFNKPKGIENVSKIILPGVGSFKYAIENLKKQTFLSYLKEIVPRKVKCLGICLGMQLLYEYSEENNGCEGLGLIKGSVKRINEKIGFTVPNIGWHEIECDSAGNLIKNLPGKPIFYFVHSYACHTNDKQLVKGKLHYSETFDVILESGNIFATQFHPEKSQKVGLKILENFCRL